MVTIPEPGSTMPLIQPLGREDRFTKLPGHRDCLSLCHYTGAKTIISVELGHEFLSEGTQDCEHLISPGRNIIYPIHKQIRRLVINMRKAYMEQMAEGRRMGTSVATKQQGKGTWTGAGSLMPTPSPSKVNQAQAAWFTREGTGATKSCMTQPLSWLGCSWSSRTKVVHNAWHHSLSNT